jgi:hypothetical protein
VRCIRNEELKLETDYALECKLIKTNWEEVNHPLLTSENSDAKHNTVCPDSTNPPLYHYH